MKDFFMKPWVLAGGGVLVGLVLALVLFRGGGNGGHEHSHADGGAATAAKGEVWTCAMHPQIRQNEPGNCPICGMALTPASQTHTETLTSTQYGLSEAAKALAEIETEPVERRLPEAHVRLFGKAAYDETRLRTLSARFPGRIDRLYIDFTGIEVSQGDHLANIYSPELLSAQSELLAALRFESRSQGADLAREKLRLWGLSDERISSIEKSGKASDNLDIDAPIGGVVIQKHINEGDYVNTGTKMFQIADLDRVWVMLDAYESDLPWVRFGQHVKFTVAGLPGKTFEGQVAFIDPQLDPQTRTVKVRVNAENERGMLKPGMFVTAEVVANIARDGRVLAPELAGKWISPMHPEIVKDAPGTCDICGMKLVRAEELGYVVPDKNTQLPLMVPESAVLQTGKRALVYVETQTDPHPIYEAREIVLGPKAQGYFMVKEEGSDLKEGEKVVSQGAFKIDSAMQIAGKDSMMNRKDEADPRLQLPEAMRPAYTRLFETYEALHAALAADDETESKKAATAFAEAWKAVDTAALDEAAKAAWDELAAALTKAAPEAAGAGDMEALRQAFDVVSQGMIQLARRFGPPGEGDAYVVHCPMAFGSQAAEWLQNVPAISNPYLGAKMPRCGEVTETLSVVAPEARLKGVHQEKHVH